MGNAVTEDKDIAKFKGLYLARFGIEIDDETARRKLSALVKQMEVIYRPIKRDDAIYVNGDVNENEASQTP